jgi:hypothetical protein
LKETVEFVPLFNIKTGTGIGYKTSWVVYNLLMFLLNTEANNSKLTLMTIPTEFGEIHPIM